MVSCVGIGSLTQDNSENRPTANFKEDHAAFLERERQEDNAEKQGVTETMFR